LAANDIESAYASGQAVLALNGSYEQTREAKAILARCYLKRGAISDARKIIMVLVSENPDWWRAREDSAAIHLVEGDFAAAVQEFEKIPAEKLSAEAQSAFQFAKQKLSA